MKKSDLIDLALKIFGVALLVEGVLSLKESVIIVYSQVYIIKSTELSDFMILILTYGRTILFQVAIGLFLIMRSHKMSNRLVSSTENPSVDFTIDKMAAMEIAFAIIGGLMMIRSISSLGYSCIKLIQNIQADIKGNDTGMMNIAWCVILIFLGYITISARTMLARHFTKGNK